MFDTLKRDIQAAKERDPACRGTLEVLLCYPGIHALWFHRLAHRCWRAGFLLLARCISHLGRFFTGIEIHPAATIGPGQGVTLGGTSLERVKRHPTIQRNVVIGSGAKVLGPFTVGENSRIGSGSVVVKEVPPNSVVVGVPGRVIYREGRKVTTPIDLNMVDLPDPVAQAIQGVVERLEELEQEVASLRVAREAAQRQPAASAPGERS
ncbi:MAG: serine acetyltransferase [candidate division NC10 bacterium]|nr:serine acetyltransferase [candidate division NC10 bacterium]